MMALNESETKIFYYIDDEETPYLVKVPVPLAQVTLHDFKSALQRTNYKFFFKSLDADFGVVKEEIVEDAAVLPAFKGRVVSWLVSTDGSNTSDNASQVTATTASTGAATDSLNSPQPRRADPRLQHGQILLQASAHHGRQPAHHHGGRQRDRRLVVGPHQRAADSSSVMTSDVDSSTVLDSDESDESDLTSRMSTTTDESSVSRLYHQRQQAQLRRRRRKRLAGLAASTITDSSSVTDSSMSLNIITVMLNLDSVNFLGISIVGQSNRGGDGGIYVGSIMKGGAVAQDGRIEPGDMILQVNDVNFDNMSNDDAVKVLRGAVQKPGPIKLVVAKCWDPNPKGYFTIPRTEQVRPIDPRAWVAHTEAALGCTATEMPLRPPSVSTVTSSSLDTELDSNPLLSLSVDTSSMQHITEVMAAPDSGLDVRDRMWLKITIRNAFLGSDCVEWLLSHVQGFHDRKDAKKYATLMLKENFIKHTVNKSNFSEQCYYVFSEDIVKRMHDIRLEHPGAPVELSSGPTGWSMPVMPAYTGQYTPQPFLSHPAVGPPPPPTYAQPTLASNLAPTGGTANTAAYTNNEVSYVNFGREGSVNSSTGSGGSGHGNCRQQPMLLVQPLLNASQQPSQLPIPASLKPTTVSSLEPLGSAAVSSTGGNIALTDARAVGGDHSSSTSSSSSSDSRSSALSEQDSHSLLAAPAVGGNLPAKNSITAVAVSSSSATAGDASAAIAVCRLGPTVPTSNIVLATPPSLTAINLPHKSTSKNDLLEAEDDADDDDDDIYEYTDKGVV